MSSVIQTILKKKSVFLVLLFVVVGLTLSAHGARAGWDNNWFTELISYALFPVLELLALVLSWVAEITNWAMQPSPITTSSFVKAGVNATRDFANSLFILILLGIALDFILFNSFGVKRALPKLLIIALLINFSVPIAGVVLDFANIISTHFLASVSGKGFTEAIAQSVGLVNIFDADASGLHKVIDPTAESAVKSSFINILFSIGLLLGMIFIFLALALMFLIRTGYISVLLILLPIALVLSAFPPTQNHFSKWMSKFMQWTMFAPAATFFLYLSTLLLVETGSKGILEMGGAGIINNDDPTYIFLRYIMAWGLMLMSLTVAQSMGITGASTAKAMWSKGTKWARGKAYGAAKTGATAAGRRAKVDEKLEGLAKGLRVIPGLGGMLESGVRGIGSKTKMAMEKQEGLTQQQKTQYEKSSDEQLRSEYDVWAKSRFPGSGAKAAQIAEILARRGKLNVLNKDGTMNDAGTKAMVEEAYGFAKQHKYKGVSESIMKANPIVYQKIVQKEWEKLESEGKLSVERDEKGNVTKRWKKDTGETFEDAKNKAFEKMGSTDFEGLKGAWDETAVRSFLFSGAMGSNHIRMASNANDHAFITNLSSALEKLTDAQIKSLQQKSPSLVSFLTGGRARDFIKVPDSFIDAAKEKKSGEKKEGREEKSKLVDQFGRPLE